MMSEPSSPLVFGFQVFFPTCTAGYKISLVLHVCSLANYQTQRKVGGLSVRAPFAKSNIVFKPARDWVGHQKDGVITEATDGQCVRSGRMGGWPQRKLNTEPHIDE